MEYPMIHICYRVMDLTASENFYRDAFGFEIARKKDYPEGRFTLSYMTSAGLPFELELTYNYDQPEPYVIGNGYSHLAVAVTDLEASHQHHTAMGLPVTPLNVSMTVSVVSISVSLVIGTLKNLVSSPGAKDSVPLTGR